MMKKILIKQLGFILIGVAFLATACSTNVSITKRYHNRGFHIALGSNKHSGNGTMNPKTAKVSLSKAQTSRITECKINTTTCQPTIAAGSSPSVILFNPQNELHKTNPSNTNWVVKNPTQKLNVYHSSQSLKFNTANNTDPKNQKNRMQNKNNGSPIWNILSFVCGLSALYIVIICSAPGIDVPLFIIVGILLAIASVFFGAKGQYSKLKVFAFLGILIGGLAFLMGLLTALLGTGAG
jgi:hypothetical protein